MHIEKAPRRDPDKAGGRQFYLTSLCDHLRSRAWQHSTREVPANVHQKIFSGHAKLWRLASIPDQRAFQTLAIVKAAETRKFMEEEFARLRTDRDLLLHRMSDDSQESKPILFSQCAVSDEHWAMLGELLHSE